jgi:N,N'-diacetyllegionaminate synthase
LECCERVVFEIGPTITPLDTALKLALVTKEANADPVNAQMLDTDQLMADKSIKFEFFQLSLTDDVQPQSESLYVVLKRRTLTNKDSSTFFEYREALNLDVISTVSSQHYIELARDLGSKELKIASGDISHISLIEQASRTGLPLHLDTGNTSIQELKEAISAASFTKSEVFYLHYCPPGYPAKFQDVNL